MGLKKRLRRVKTWVIEKIEFYKREMERYSREKDKLAMVYWCEGSKTSFETVLNILNALLIYSLI